MIFCGQIKRVTIFFLQKSQLFRTGYVETFIRRCTTFNVRYKFRLILELVIFFLLPAVVSGYFYFAISKSLKTQEKRKERNKTLIRAFIISWVLWIVCWSPEYPLLIFSERTRDEKKLREHMVFSGTTFWDIHCVFSRQSK